jgi:hypothetical protein
MGKKSKKKKQKKPNIPVQTMARPQLEQILARRRHDELDDDEFVASIEALMGQLDQEAVLNALIGLLDNADNEQKDALMVAIPKLGNAQTIKHLWQLVRRSKLSVGAKMTTLVILKQMGEDVDLDNPGNYFSWRDVKQADVDEIESMGRFGTQAIIKELQKLDNVDDVEAMMLRFREISDKTGGEAMLEAMIDDLVEMGNSDAADMIAAISATTSYAKVRQTARKGLLKLSDQKIFPQTQSIKALVEERFYAAYCTDPAHPWQQQVAILFERGNNLVQALVFLLDFGHPWKGAIKDFFPTESITPRQFQREFIDRTNRQGVEQGQVSYARARQFILDALAANRKNKVKLPLEYEQFRPMVERRIVDPSPETLAYAEKIDAETVDEWGELEGEPVRGMEIIGPDGEAIAVMPMEDLDDEFWDELEEDEIEDFDDLLANVEDYYEEVNETLDEGQAYILPHDWMVSYLTARHEAGFEPDELDEFWLDLSDFLLYLDEGYNTPKTLADIQGHHLSEFVSDFWDEHIDKEAPADEKEEAVETVRDLYDYLAEQKLIPAEAAKRVAAAADTLFSQPDELTPIPRPEQ